MANSKEQLVPEGWRTVTPRIVARNAPELFAFIVRVFEATGNYRVDRPAVLKIGDSNLMISEAGVRSPMTGFFYVYVSDTDATYQRAVEAGARTLEPPLGTPYGDRRCMIEDSWGNTWQIATYHPEEQS